MCHENPWFWGFGVLYTVTGFARCTVNLWLVFYQHQMEVQVGLAMWDCGTLMSGHFINIVYVWRACSSGFCPHFIAFHYHGLVSWFVDVAHHPVCLTISLPTLRSTLMVHLPVNLGRFSSGVTTSYISVVLKRKRRTEKWGTNSTCMLDLSNGVSFHDTFHVRACWYVPFVRQWWYSSVDLSKCSITYMHVCSSYVLVLCIGPLLLHSAFWM